MISIPPTNMKPTPTIIVISSLEKPISSDCYLHDAVQLLQGIKGTVQGIDRRDPTRQKFTLLIQDLAAFLYTFCEDNYAELAGRHLSFALTQLWLQYQERIMRLLADLSTISKRQSRTTLLQRKFGSSSRKTSTEVARINTYLSGLSMSSMASLSALVMKAHMSGCVKG